MTDFFKEVDEDYRRDQLAAFWKRYQVPIILLAVAIVAGAGGWRYWSDARTAAAEKVNARYEAAGALADDGKSAEAQAAFLAIAKDGPVGYAALSRFRAAEVEAGADPEGAAKAFDAIAGDEPLPQSLRDTARLRGALLRLDHEDPKAFERRYGRFAEDAAFTYRNSMRELMALAALKNQDFPTTGRYLDAILGDVGAPPSLRARAQAFRLLVNGGPTTAMTQQPKPATITPPLAAPEPPPTETPSTPRAAAPATPVTPSTPKPPTPKPPTPKPPTPKPPAPPAR